MAPVDSWLSEFKADGYKQFPQLLNADVVRAARDRIDLDLAKNYDPARKMEYDNLSFCPGIRDSAEIMNLFKDQNVQRVIDTLIPLDQLSHDTGQIAIRQAHNTDTPYAPVPHIDGIPTPYNGVSGSELRTFTMLVGVFLSDVPSDFAGNFTVWPGSHLLLETYFQQRGPASLREGMPHVNLEYPKQLHCRPGDVVVCHYLLAHAAAVNTSDNDRYAVFFRLWHRDLDGKMRKAADANRWIHLTKIWTGWHFESRSTTK